MCNNYELFGFAQWIGRSNHILGLVQFAFIYNINLGLRYIMKKKILVRSIVVSIALAVLAPLAVYQVLKVESIQWLPYALLSLIFLLVTMLVTWVSGAWDGVFEPNYAPRTSLGVQSSDEVGLQETGTVKWFDAGKGYGFILRDSGAEIFVHYRSLMNEGHRSLFEGQRVAFVIAQGRKGLQAEEVVPIEA